MIYNYAEKSFNWDQRSNIWASIRSDFEADLILKRAKSSVESVLALHPKDIVSEDEAVIEEALGKLEIAIRRIEDSPNLFTFNDEVKSEFKSSYNELCEKFAPDYSKTNFLVNYDKMAISY
ncbi:hypothetical protein ACPV3A_24350 [Paenibacillus sp. Dod16]|uniref:hypothetical protein n=1 Tax=Paenibacillus sp. Dod16 TaxID=3416392 RepID=UPI003CEDBB00